MGKVILITGGSRGLGSYLVERLAGDKASTVVFTYLASADKAALLANKGDNIVPFSCDQREEGQVKACYDMLAEKFGGLDVLINNACSPFRPHELLASEWDEFQGLLDSNLKGAFYHTREAANLMKQRGAGRIINVLTTYVTNVPPEKLSFYITAKYALLGLTKSSAAELVKYGITVNAVSPGMMETELSAYMPRKYLELYSGRHPMKRMTTVADTADVIEFLISDGAGFLNGINIPVNGGESF